MENPVIEAVLAEEAGAELELFSARDEAAGRLAAAQELAKTQLEQARQDAAAAMRQARAQAAANAEKAEQEAAAERDELSAKLRETTLPKMGAAVQAVLEYLG